MTDELYDYFGGNASKKVEPIEDDELDLPNDGPAKVENESEAEAVAEDVSEETAAFESDDTEVKESVEAELSENAEAEPENAGHWDFLASMLGIGGKEKKQAKAAEPKSKKTRVSVS